MSGYGARDAASKLGSQIWLEPDDSKERVERLFRLAQESGLGWVRLFLMWPFIEREPGQWEFGVFDYAFDAAAACGIRIKATLTVNSGPWHIGTPSMLHSGSGVLADDQYEPMARYIEACVKRYRGHPALGQWILWNEPSLYGERSEPGLRHWRSWLKEKYGGDVQKVNKRWMTGYRSFEEIPYPDEVPHELHRRNHWNSYGPWLDDWQSRSAWLNEELAGVLAEVRRWDADTETCVNPQPLLSNQAEGGIDLERMGALVDVIGASYHPAWMFTFAERADYPALMAAGVQYQLAFPSVKRGEVTEVQTGNTLNSSTRPSDATPAEIARFFLASLAAGAESATGWCFNTRSRDFEAGDWGLLDNSDEHSERSRMMRRIRDTLDQAYTLTGEWYPYQPDACIGFDPGSQAVEWIEARTSAAVPGRLASDGAHGASLLAACLMAGGIRAGLAPIRRLTAAVRPQGMIVLSHMVAWDTEETEDLLDFASQGGTLLFDATCGRKTRDAALHRPWPGGLAQAVGLRALGLQTRPEGYAVVLNGLPAGRWLLTRMDVQFEPEARWSAWTDFRYQDDGEPCVWERSFGAGKIVFVNGMVGPTLVHAKEAAPGIRALLGRAYADQPQPDVQPVTDRTIAIPVRTDRGSLTVVLAPSLQERGGRHVKVRVPAGDFTDLWTTARLSATAYRELDLEMKDGIAMLWRDR